jgi:hypothetical protein
MPQFAGRSQGRSIPSLEGLFIGLDRRYFCVQEMIDLGGFMRVSTFVLATLSHAGNACAKPTSSGDLCVGSTRYDLGCDPDKCSGAGGYGKVYRGSR